MDIASPLEVLLQGAVKIGMAMTIPAIPLLPALDIQGYGIHFYIISLSSLGHTGISDLLLYDISFCLYMVAKQNIDIRALIILQPCVK